MMFTLFLLSIGVGQSKFPLSHVVELQSSPLSPPMPSGTTTTTVASAVPNLRQINVRPLL